MEDAKAKAVETAASSEKGEFKLKDPGALLTLYKVGKKTKFLNHYHEPVDGPEGKVPVATQAQLKEVYDADPTYAKFVIAPAGHKAPWQK